MDSESDDDDDGGGGDDDDGYPVRVRWYDSGLIIDRLAKFFRKFLPETKWSITQERLLTFSEEEESGRYTINPQKGIW